MYEHIVNQKRRNLDDLEKNCPILDFAIRLNVSVNWSIQNEFTELSIVLEFERVLNFMKHFLAVHCKEILPEKLTKAGK